MKIFKITVTAKVCESGKDPEIFERFFKEAKDANLFQETIDAYASHWSTTWEEIEVYE